MDIIPPKETTRAILDKLYEPKREKALPNERARTLRKEDSYDVGENAERIPGIVYPRIHSFRVRRRKTPSHASKTIGALKASFMRTENAKCVEKPAGVNLR